MILGAGMTRPTPAGDCAPGGQRPRPSTPEQARQMEIKGMVLVEYVVHSDGHVGEVTLKNQTAPPILFEAVKQWLLSCSFTPSMQGSRPIPVKIIQPFNFTLR
jgi:TonB family protein